MPFAEDQPDYIRAHGHSSCHKQEILESRYCGCFYCLETFYPDEIKEWTDRGQTALCPRCNIDAVIGDKAGYPLNANFLGKMSSYWFS